MFSVSPIAYRAVIDDRMASGMDTAMMTVERQLPRNSRIIRLVNMAAMTASFATPVTAAFTNMDWSPIASMCTDEGRVSEMTGNIFLTLLTISSVDAAPLFRMVIRTARLPLTRTILVCGGLPSRTLATSRI